MTRDVKWKAEGAVAVDSLAAAINAAKDWLGEQLTGETALYYSGRANI